MLYNSVKNILSYRQLSRNVNIRIYKAIFLAMNMYECVTWFRILSEENRLRIFENRVLGRIFGPKRDEVTGEWRKLHNEELRNLFSLLSIIRMSK
jgi:uncharacterized membrane protein